MSALIVVRFYDAGVPATGLSPTIDIIKQSDNTVVVNDASMTENIQGFYRYEFQDYDNSEVYLFAIDGGVGLSMGDRYLDGTNEFDSYGNKGTWGRSVMIDPELPRYVADAVWEVKTIDHKREGTFGEQAQKTIDKKDILVGILGIKESLSAIVDQVKTTVTAIKIPEGVSKTDIADAVDTGFADFDSKVASAIAKYSNKDDWKTIVDDGIASGIDTLIEKLDEAVVEISNVKGEVSAVDARSRLKDMDLDTMLQRIEDVIQNRSEIDNLKSADIESLRKIRTDVQRCEFTLQGLFIRLQNEGGRMTR